MRICDIELKNVTKHFGKVVAVNDVSFCVYQGEFFSLLGPSGCGKTTTLRMIAGFEEPTEGEIFLSGKSMKNVPPHLRDTSMVFQRLALFPHMTVFQNVEYGLRKRGVPKTESAQRVRDILELVRLTGLEKRKPSQLSGGQQQRVALARSLVIQPTVLLLDEPLASLDRKLRVNMQLELKRIQREVGTTFIYVTHDQEEALTMSDRLAVMNEGDIEQIGTASEIYEKPRTRFIADFIGNTNLITGRVVEADRDKVIVLSEEGMRCVVKNEGNLKMGLKVALSIRPEKIIIGNGVASLDNSYKVVVLDNIYQGPVSKCVTTWEGKQELTIELLNVNIAEGPRIGDKIEVGWNADSCVVLI